MDRYPLYSFGKKCINFALTSFAYDIKYYIKSMLIPIKLFLAFSLYICLVYMSLKVNKFQKLSQLAFYHNIGLKQLQLYIFVFTCHRCKKIHEKMNSLAIKTGKQSLFVSVR